MRSETATHLHIFHLLSSYYVSRTMLSSLITYTSYLILITALLILFHFINEETETQRSWVLCPESCSVWWYSCVEAGAVDSGACLLTTGLRCLLLFSLRGSLVAQLVENPPAMQETWVQSLGWEVPLEKGKATHSSILAWRIPWTV